MAILWDVRVQGGEGKELYGNDYSDIWAINRLHFMAASGYECDHVSRREKFFFFLFFFFFFSYSQIDYKKNK